MRLSPATSFTAAPAGGPLPEFRSKRAKPMETVVKLPPRLDGHAVAALARKLSEAAGLPLRLDGADIVYTGALGLQLIAATARQWRADGLTLQIDPPGTALRDSCQRLGIAPEEIALAATAGTQGLNRPQLGTGAATPEAAPALWEVDGPEGATVTPEPGLAPARRRNGGGLQ